jgi:hypothetical protein
MTLFVDLQRLRQPFNLCPHCQPAVVVQTPVGFRSQYRPSAVQRHDLGRMRHAYRFCKALY